MLACVAGTLSIASCSSDNTEAVEKSTVKTFYVAAPSNSSRAVISGSLEDAGPKVIWEQTDKIKVWGKGLSAGEEFVWSSYSRYHNTAAFTGTIADATEYFLMYPYQTEATLTESNDKVYINAKLPSVQKAVSGGFDPAAALCACASATKSSQSVELKHLCAYLKIKTQQPCKSITFSANPSDTKIHKIAGQLKIDVTTENVSIVQETTTTNTGITAAGAVTSIKLTSDGTESPTTDIPAGTYLIAIPPHSAFPGLKVDIDYGNNNVVTTEHTTSHSFVAGYIYNLGKAN